MSKLILPRHLRDGVRGPGSQRGFIINPYAYATGGGSGGVPPSTYAGLTFEYDGDLSPHYLGSSTSSGAPPDGVNFERADSANALSHSFNGFYMGERKIPVAGSVNGFRTNDGTNPYQAQIYQKPAGTAAPSVLRTFANFFTTSNAIIVMAFKINNIGNDSGNPPPFNPCIVGGVSGYFGLFGKKAGSNVTLQGYNYDAGYNEVNQTLALTTWAVGELRHVGGRLKLRLNNGTFADIASGTTDATTDQITIGDANAAVNDFEFANIAFYNAARTEAEIANVATWMGARVGLTI